jgi:hypothetical protein
MVTFRHLQQAMFAFIVGMWILELKAYFRVQHHEKPSDSSNSHLTYGILGTVY